MSNFEPQAKINEFNFDFGTKPTSGALETVNVVVDPKVMLGDFAKAYAAELHRRNPLRAEQANITEEEFEKYFTQIVNLRIQKVHEKCHLWREIKQLNIPTWIQFVISLLGEIIDYDFGLRVMPYVEDDSVDIDFLLDISLRLEAFKSDGVTMHKDAFPRKKQGDKEVMTMAIIDGFVKSMSKDSHPIASYVAAFLGVKLQEEQAFKILYRVRYDDVLFVRRMLMNEDSLV